MPMWHWHVERALRGVYHEAGRRIHGPVPKKGRLNRWARKTGFCKRKGKVRPFDFVVLMTIGQLGMKHPSLAGMVAAIEARITRVALHYRFTAEATAFMFKCLCFVFQQKFSRLGQIDTKLLRPFGRVLIVDSSSWEVSEKLRNVLPGSGGGASEACCKLQAVYDYKHGELQFVEVMAGTDPDNRYTNNLPGMLNKGDLILFDQGYFKLSMNTDYDASFTASSSAQSSFIASMPPKQTGCGIPSAGKSAWRSSTNASRSGHSRDAHDARIHRRGSRLPPQPTGEAHSGLPQGPTTITTDDA